jgi:DNA polymerase III subunit delta'
VAPPVEGGRWLTRGHPAAVAAVASMVVRGVPHAILISGPPGVGKTTLALDLAAALLCDAADPAARPCRTCRACRLVESGNHPDLHRLAPAGPGDQIRIGSRQSPEAGTVRRLVSDLAMLAMEGRARVAVVERANRMNEDAQSAFLKTLEEPPAGVTLILCADEEEGLIPTVRSRCSRLRLGPVPTRDVEAILGDLGAAEPPIAARLSRLAAGRPGAARAWAAPGALEARTEIALGLLDLSRARPWGRLAAARDLLKRAGETAAALEAVGLDGPPPTPPGPPVETADPPDGAAVGEAPEVEPAARTRVPPAARRRGASLLIGIWRDVARDLALVGLEEERPLRDPLLLDDLRLAADSLRAADVTAFLDRLERAGELIDANVSPELVVDDLVLAWPSAPAETAREVRGAARNTAPA